MVVILGFEDIAELVGHLPQEALSDRSWWTNSPRAPQSRAWRRAGWNVGAVSLATGTVAFLRGHLPST